MSDELPQDRWTWWGARRRRYNIALVLAGIAAFILYAIAFETQCRGVPEAEITLFTTLFQGVGYLIAIGVANVMYTLGPVLEPVLGRRDVAAYRRTAYPAGFWFSVALPFSVPALTFAYGCR